jgi:hypothetical protein
VRVVEMRAGVLVASVVLLAADCSSGPTESGATSTLIASSERESTVFVSSDWKTSGSGPLQAALTYVAATDALMAHSSIGRAEILGSLLTPAAAREQSAALEGAVEQMALTLDVPVERLTWVEAPLTATLREHDESSASVAVWTVSVLGSPAAGSPQQVWRTVHVELDLVDGRWLVSAATADAGPTPAGNDVALQSGWDEFNVVANWDPVVPGVTLAGGDR